MNLCNCFKELPNFVASITMKGVNVDDLDLLIGKNLRRLRENKGLSQDELGAKVGNPASKISALENGKEGLGKLLLLKICKVLEVKPHEFYIQSDTPIPSTPLQHKLLNVAKLAEAADASYVAEELAEYVLPRLEKIERTRKTAGKGAAIRDKAG